MMRRLYKRESVKLEKTEFDKNNLPLVIYKYRKWEGVHKTILTKKEIYLSSPTHFNKPEVEGGDPMDCRHPIRFDKVTRKQKYGWFYSDSLKYNKGYTEKEHRDFAKGKLLTARVNDPASRKKGQELFFQEYNGIVGILSLTENPIFGNVWIPV